MSAGFMTQIEKTEVGKSGGGGFEELTNEANNLRQSLPDVSAFGSLCFEAAGSLHFPCPARSIGMR